ncbi:pyridoxine 5'-phosphate synthase [Fulvivirga sp. M361]|uniref:pyridoxine 5'-phosphate synthase n=1 Tax=Fulvivirga sp. M361 TaxID=2594266 RepID=UPI00117B3431|nr:pyridoxine 5'-phosphate synthase [Fulvivirga sp. M361]TRX50443.1 pyridoxine 5'-phosphate synthase [Fulvivirga sp. M361]
MTRLSVNINKFATLRNARGGNNPDLVKSAVDCEHLGAQGITVHPRPDERHIRYDDVLALSEVITTEFNIEGYPDKRYMELVHKVKPTQATLVPDAPNVLTSNAGWDTMKHRSMLVDRIAELKESGVRTSIFVDPNEKMIEGAAETGTNRIELYTESYASNFLKNKEAAILPFKLAAARALALDIEINAGHDLDRHNLTYFISEIPETEEVSIGHALICDAIYLGLENTIQLYLKCLKQAQND